MQSRRALILCLAAAVRLSAAPAHALTYTATVLNITGYDQAFVNGGDGIHAVGFVVVPNDVNPHAAVWNGTSNPVDLSIPGFGHTEAVRVSGNSQVGWGDALDYGEYHALLWHGSAASAVDLNPPGYSSTIATDVSGNTQVGAGMLNNVSQALMWTGSANSVINLTPSKFDAAQLQAISGNIEVGSVYLNNHAHAAMWFGSSPSALDLNSPAYVDSIANDVADGYQVGYGVPATSVDNFHAVVWHGSANTAVDLQPAGFTNSDAMAIAGGRIVGFGQTAADPSHSHALAWTATGGAASMQDLHQYLPNSHPFRDSIANDIGPNGVIVGTATDVFDLSWPVMWTPNYMPGDFNHDDKVDTADYVTWRKGLGTYTQTDYEQWRTHFGQTAGSASASIPEPSSFAVFIAVILMVSLRRPRHLPLAIWS